MVLIYRINHSWGDDNFFWYSLKYNPAIRHTDDTTSKVSWFDPKEKTEENMPTGLYFIRWVLTPKEEQVSCSWQSLCPAGIISTHFDTGGFRPEVLLCSGRKPS